MTKPRNTWLKATAGITGLAAAAAFTIGATAVSAAEWDLPLAWGRHNRLNQNGTHGACRNEKGSVEMTKSPDRFLREPEVKRITGLGRTTRWRLERVGKFPRRRKISHNAVAWLASEVDTWMAEQEQVDVAA